MGEETARVAMLHYIRIADSIVKFMENRDDFTQCPRKDGAFQCRFKTYASTPHDIDLALQSHHCQVDDYHKAGAYAWVIVDEKSSRLVHIVDMDFGSDLRESLYYLSLAERWAVATTPNQSTIEASVEGDYLTLKELFQKYGRIHLVFYELDESHPESFWGRRKDGHEGVSHHAEAVKIEEFQSRARSDPPFAYCLNSSPSHPTNKKFSERNFSFYQDQILKKISDGDRLIFSEPDFEALAVKIRKINGFLSSSSVLTKRHHVECPDVFQQIISPLENLNRHNGTRFTALSAAVDFGI